ncbi:MAG: YcjX family protein [Cypionkella sp.]|nr:YcjX family protein [Cypionkella sp.]
MFSSLASGVSRQISEIGAQLSGLVMEPALRLGVTGLSRAGKTVFITSLVANLLDRSRMGQLTAGGRIEAVYLQPQPDDTLPRFAYEDHLAALTGDAPTWPQSTRAVSELRLSFRIAPYGVLAGLTGPRLLHVDIVDYPGEWLLDLALLDKSYAQWSEEVLSRLPHRSMGADYLAMARAEDGALKLDETRAAALVAAFTQYLHAARAAGWSDCTPGRFLLPGDLAGSPALTFAPLPPSDTPRGSLAREMARRFEAYKSQIVQPFFRQHFAKIDRQIVLVDVLDAVHQGPRALEDLRRTMADVLGAFRPGRSRFLSQILGGKRVEKILFAATKADHLHHTQHPALTAIMQAMLREAISRADFAGAKTSALSIAALRCTVEEMLTQNGSALPAVRGRQHGSGKQVALYAGELPADPMRLLSPARQGAEKWLDADFGLMQFAPAKGGSAGGIQGGLPHIRLDRAAEFLIGDRL